MSGGRDWTTTEVRQLHEMRAKRVKTKEIAATLGRTEDAIWSFLRYIPATRDCSATVGKIPALPKKPKPKRSKRTNSWRDCDIAMLRQLAASGASSIETATALGRTPEAVRTKAYRMKIRFRHQGGAPVYEKELTIERLHRNAAEGSAKLLNALLAMAA